MSRSNGWRACAFAAKAVGLAVVVSTLACEGGKAPGQKLEGYRAATPVHKVQLDSAQAAELEKRGAKVLGDYGAFKLVQVDDASLDQVKPAAGVELRDDYNHILLNAGTIDSASPQVQALRGMKAAPTSGKRLHLVQFVGPIRPEWYSSLSATGVQVVTYIPNNAYLVYGDANALNNLRAFSTSAPSIQWDGDYLADYKLDPSINTIETATYAIQLVEDGEANEATLQLIRGLETREGVVQSALGYVNVVASVDRKSLYEIATRPDVVSIQPRPTPRLFDERQNMIVSGHLSGGQPTGPGFLAWLASKGFTQTQFLTSGFGVDVTDSGVDNATTSPNHFGLYVGGNVNGASRLAYARLEGTPNSGSTIQGCDGHGNINAHIIAGYANQSAAPYVDGAGYAYGLGVAPFVKVGSSVIFDPGTFTSPVYENLQSRAYRDGMRISSNSWGAATPSYTSDAQRYDALVRDAQPATAAVPAAGNQEMVIVFAAGNSGSGASTIGSPGTGKNVISVGASENVHAFGGADACGIGDTGADSAHDIIGFSSRGPTADGRKKPDLMAPGTHVTGGVAQAAGQRANPPANPNGQANSCFDATGVCAGASNNFFPAGQQWFTASSGTSHSTPAVAGAAALLRQDFINRGMNPASPAMTKAYLMNSARYMTGVGANDSLFSNNQGMGLMDLGLAFDGVPRLMDDQNAANLFTATGQTRNFVSFVSDPTKPLRVTLAWTDAPGSTTGSAWRNNLDLTVTIGGNTYRGNVFTGPNSVTGGSADVANNVESVFLPAGQTGTVTVTVTATNINSDGVPGNASALDQDFALVVYNTCASQPAAPSAVTGTANGDNRIDLNWTPSGAPQYRVYRSTTAGGPYTRIATVAAPPYSDTSVSGGVTYYYVIRAFACAESADLGEVSVTANGVCTLPPTFAGLTSATPAGTATCANTLAWSAGTPACGGTLSYSVYRGTTSGFTPSNANRIATGVSGTSFADNLNLTQGTTYYYVVRAVETAGATTEETNTVQRSAAPTGAVTPGLRYFDNLDTNRPPNASSYWIPTVQAGVTGTMNLTTGCHFQSPSGSYRIGAISTACGGTYPNSQQTLLSLGGNGAVAGINGFNIPSTATNPTMTFNVWYSLESGWDGVWLMYSTTSATGPWNDVPDTATAGRPYITAGGYDGTINSVTPRVWVGNNNGANGALKPVSVNLNALAGQRVWFGWKFWSDSSVVLEGFYVDDVRITADTVGSCTTNVPPPGPAASYRVTGLPASVQSGTASTVTVTALDAMGQVAAGYSGTATFSSSDSQATLPSSVSFTAGVATASVTMRTAGTQTVTASDSGNSAITGSASTNVTPGAPARLVFLALPSSVVAGSTVTPAVRVSVTDDSGNLVTSASTNITLSISNNPGGGTLSGTRTVATVNGVATFSDLSIDKAGIGYSLLASATGLTGGIGSSFNVTAASPAKLAFSVQPPSSTQAGFSLNPAVEVAVLDAFDNVTTSSAPVSVALASGPAGSILLGTTSTSAVNGVASFPNLSLDKVGSGYTLQATSATLTSATSSSFAVTPGTPYRAVITRQPSDVVAGSAITPAVQATLYDRFANLATQATNAVAVSLGNAQGATLGGTTTVNAVAGVATFSALSVDRAGTNYTLVAGGSGLFADTSVGFDVSAGAPAKLAFLAQPGTSAAGASIAPAVRVAIQDASGNLITTSSASVTLSLGSNPGGAALSGTTTANAVNGVATFSNLSLDKVGTGYTLRAQAMGLPSQLSSGFDIVPGAAATLAFLTQPSNTVAGAAISPAVRVVVRDAFGNTATSSSASVTLAFGNNAGSGTLSGGTPVTAVNGVATFSNVSVDRVGTGYTLAASSAGLTGATSAAFNVAVGAVARLAFGTQPGNAVAGSPITPAVTVTLQDAHGNPVSSATTSVSLSLTGPSGATLGGTTTVAAVNGTATFANLSVNRAATGYRLTAAAAGLPNTSSVSFDVSVGAPAQLVFITQPANATAGAALAPAVQVQVRDAMGNTVTSAAGAIGLSLGANPGGGTLSGTTTATPVNGVATFANVSVDKVARGYSLRADSAGLTSAVSAGFDVGAGAAARLAFLTQPSDSVAGAAISPAVQVVVLDAFGNTASSSSASVTLAFGNNAGGGTLGGAATVNAVNGVATFSNASVNRAGAGYTLAATAPGLAGSSSAAFNVVAGAAARLVFSGQPGNTVAGSAINPAVTVDLEDAYGNAVSASSIVTLSLSGVAGGTLGGTTSAAAVNGSASFGDLFINQAGRAYRLTATAPGLQSASSFTFDVSAGPAASLVFITQPRNATAGVALAPAVQVRVEDAVGNTVTSAAGAISLSLGANPGSGTLSGTTTATPVNGVATFGNLSVNRVGSGYSLQADSAGLAGALSAGFDVNPGAAAQLAFVTEPSDTVAGMAIAPAVQVVVRDGYGNTVTSSSASITLGLGNNAGALRGATTVNALNGVATFSNASIERAGIGYTLAATSPGLSGANSAAFNVAVGAPARLAFASQPGSTVAGSAINPVAVVLQDAYGNEVPASGSVTLSLAGPSGATLGGTTTVEASNGSASFADLFVNQAGRGYRLTATADGVQPANSAAFDIAVGPAARLAFLVQPGTSQAGAFLAPAVRVAIQDAVGNTVTTATSTVTLSFDSNAAGGALSGTTSAPAVNGVATFADLSINRAGAGYVLRAGSGTLSGASSAFDITVGPAARLAFRTPPANGSAGTALSPVSVELQDAFGNLTADETDVTVSLGGPGSAIGGTTTVTSVGGVATFPDLVITRAGTGYALTAGTSGLANVTSGAFDISAGPAVSLVYTVQPSNARAGVALIPSVKVAIHDAFGNVVTSATDNVSLAFGTNPANGTLSGTTTVAAVDGVATFFNLTINKVGRGYTLVASSGTLTGATSSTFDIRPGTPAALVFRMPAPNTRAGTVFGPIEVEVRDAEGNLATDAVGSIQVGLHGPGSALGGTTTVAVTEGVASFGDLFINRAGRGYHLTARATGLTDVDSSAFDVGAGPPAALVFTVQPGLTQAGANLGPALRVAIQDALGNVVTDATDAITVALGNNPGNGALRGTATAAAVEGVATFQNLAIDRAARGYTLKATAGTLPEVSSAAFDISVGPPARLVFKTAPANTTAGAALGTVEVELQDAQGNVLVDHATDVTLSLGANPGAGVLQGVAAARATNGVASFSGLSLRKAAKGYSLVASAPAFAGATSSTFDVGPGTAANFVVALPASVTAGQPATVSATAYDGFGNVASGYSGSARVSSSDSTAVLPATHAFSEGVLTGLEVVFKRPGLRSLTLADGERAALAGTAQTNVTPFPQPTIAVTDPVGGATVGGSVSITATGAVAPGTTVGQLSILVDGQVIATGTEATLTGTWDSSKAAKGTHTITAVLSDSAGNVASSAPVGVVTAGGGGCGCSSSGVDASALLGLLALARYITWRKRRAR